LKKLIKILSANLLILLLLLVTTDLIFGDWFTKNNFGYSIRDQRNIKKKFISKLDGKNIEYFFKRDNYGFIGDGQNPEDIKVVFEGGSTGEQIYTPPEFRLVDLLNSYLKKDNFNVIISNASKGGKTTRGYVNDFKQWFPKIEKFNPSVAIFYIGINDSVLDFPSHFVRIEKTNQKERFEDYFKNNSFYYKIIKNLKQKNNPKIRLAYEISKPQDELYKNFKYINYLEAKNNYKNLNLLKKDINLLQNFEKNLNNLNYFIKKNNIRPIFITQIRFNGLKFKNLFLVNEYLKEFTKLNDYKIIKLDELVSQMNEGDFYDEMHTTPTGSIKISKFIYPRLKIYLKELNF